MKRLLASLCALAALGAVFLVACGGDDDDGAAVLPTTAATATAAAPAPVSMTIVNFTYSPASLTARVGQPIAIDIKNNDTAPHTFTIDNVVDSGRIDAAASGSAKFTPSQAGSLTWYCTIHGKDRMSGTLTVSAAAVGTPAGDADSLANAELFDAGGA